MRVLVTGATGFVGGRLVPGLLEAGHEAVALARDPDRYDGPDVVRPVRGDLLRPESLDAAFEEADVAYYLVHSMGRDGDFREADRRAAANFRDAAERSGIDRVVYLGGLGNEDDDLSGHLRSRREVEALLREGDYDLTTLRAAVIVGAGSAGFEMIRQLAERLPVMITPRWVRTPCQPIAIDDAVEYLVGVLDVPETRGETYDIGGPAVLTYEEMIRRVARLLGNHPIILPVPVLTPRLSGYWVELVTDVPESIARPLIDGLKNPVVVEDASVRELLPIELTPFDRAAARALRGGTAV